jgi:MFS family permease
MSTADDPVTAALRDVAADDYPRKTRAAVRASVLAYFVDQYAIYLPVLTLAPAAAYFQSRDVSPGTAALLSALVFTATLIARPVGAAVFGHFADTTGRKKATLVAVAGFGTCNLLIAMLPGYATIGLASVGLLIVLRFADGFFIGGEYTTAVPLAMEWSPRRKRGLYSGFITSTSPGSYTVIAALALLLLTVIPSAGGDSAYSRWGWRIPFVLGAALAAVLFAAYRRQVEEPPTERAREGRSPLVMLFTGSHRRSLLQVFVLMSGTWLATNMVSAVMPGLLRSHVGLTDVQATVVILLMMIVCTIAYVAFGNLSQRVGRRRFFIGYGLVVAIAGPISFAMSMTWDGGIVGTAVFTVLIGVCVICTFGPVAAYLTERFQSPIRASGYGVGYSLALVLPSFYAFYLGGLSSIVPGYLAPAVLIAIGGALIAVAGAWGPETKDSVTGWDRSVEATR